MSRLGTIARRTFLIGSAAVAGGVAFGWWAYRRPHPVPVTAGEGGAVLTPWVIVDADGVTIVTPRAEMGQGIHSTLAALVAEEMDLAWEEVRVTHGPPAAAYYNGAILEDGVPFAPTDTGWLAETARHAMAIPAKFLALQLTGGSTSVPDAYEKMRIAGAVAREALKAAAAARLGVAVADLRTEGGAVLAPDGTRLPYPALAAEAAALDLPEAPALRPSAEWKLLGKPLPRLDMVAKCTGTEVYAGDVRLPGMVFATVRRAPSPGGGMVAHDPAPALALPGVRAVVPLPDGVAVVGTTTWAALQGAAAVTAEWTPGPHPATSAEMEAALWRALETGEADSTPRDVGDVEAALAGEGGWMADYFAPYLAHATMEPMSGAGLFAEGRLTLWLGSQFPTMARDKAAEALGIDPSAVTVNVTALGGGFGRRAEVDFAVQTALVARAVEGSPVSLTWSREEDMAHDPYRPMAVARVRGRVEGGMVAALDLATCAPSITASLAGRMGLPMGGPDATIVQGAWEAPYALPAWRVRGLRGPSGVPIGFWRSVGASQNGFVLDSAMDEMAHLAGVDPLLFRMRQMDHAPSIKVMEAVAELSGWGSPPAPGRARGVAFVMSFGVPVAEVVEVAETPAGLRLTGAWIAADVGTALNPDTVAAQLSGAMVYGLSAAMTGEITFADGIPQELTFWDYAPMRLAQCPPIGVRVLESGGRIRGVGEPGTPPAAPALANAIFALTGQRHRRLPLRHAVTFA
jgi:isoquinoline 1-oxidoreductase beta subunit